MRPSIAQGFAILLFLAPVFFADQGLADEFLGEENGEEEAPVPVRRSGRRAAEADQDRSSCDTSVGGALGAGSGYVGGSLTVAYPFNCYVSLDTVVSYSSFDQDSSSGTQYGPEFDLVLRLPNPTMFTPFVGAGLGYEKWVRAYRKKNFDEAAAPFGTTFGGLNIGLTRHFGIQVLRRQKTWLGRAPKSFTDREREEAHASMDTSIGFRFIF